MKKEVASLTETIGEQQELITALKFQVDNGMDDNDQPAGSGEEVNNNAHHNQMTVPNHPSTIRQNTQQVQQMVSDQITNNSYSQGATAQPIVSPTSSNIPQVQQLSTAASVQQLPSAPSAQVLPNAPQVHLFSGQAATSNQQAQPIGMAPPPGFHQLPQPTAASFQQDNNLQQALASMVMPQWATAFSTLLTGVAKEVSNCIKDSVHDEKNETISEYFTFYGTTHTITVKEWFNRIESQFKPDWTEQKKV